MLANTLNTPSKNDIQCEGSFNMVGISLYNISNGHQETSVGFGLTIF